MMDADERFFRVARANRIIQEADPEREMIGRLRAWDDDNMLKEAAAECIEARWMRMCDLEASLKHCLHYLKAFEEKTADGTLGAMSAIIAAETVLGGKS